MTYHASIRGIVPETCPAIDRVIADLERWNQGLSSDACPALKDMEEIRLANTTLRGLLADALRIIARQDELLKRVPTELLERIGT